VVNFRPKRRGSAAATDDTDTAAAQPAPPRPPQAYPSSLTAAVSTVRMDGAAWKSWKFGDRKWQDEGWRLYDITGQLRFVANWVGNSVSRCRLYVGEVGEDGETVTEVDDPQIGALASAPLGRGPAKDEALRLLGINLFVPGECYIVAEGDGNGPGDDRWFVVSGGEIKRTGDDITITRGQLYGGGTMKYRDDQDLILRCWTPHPRRTDEPDSPTRSAIPDLRAIEAIRKREFAELDSRLAGAGLLGMPDGIDFPRQPGDESNPAGFMTVLQRAMAASLSDRSTAEAMVPIVFTAPTDALDKIRHITFWTELSAQLLPLMEQALRSLAQSLDIPPEVLLGLGQSNHWSAWAISEEAITTQIVPVLSRIADALTQGFLRAAIEEMGLDPDRYVYAFDTAPLTTRPNRAADALNFHERGLISDESARNAGAFSDDDAPDPEERLRRILEQLVLTRPELLAVPAVQAILGVAITIPAGAITSRDNDGGGGGDGGGEVVRDEESPPEQTPQTDDDASTAALYPVAHLALRRALTLAGSRLVPHRQRDRFPGCARHALHVKHGPVDRARAEAVLAGAWDDLHAVADDLMVDPEELRQLLHGMACELLVRGMGYDPSLLREVLRRARFARGSVAVGA
jgi:hypothetical protein